MTTTSETDETRKRQKRKAKGSVYAKPILIIGKDVPHKAPAKMVLNTALLFWLNSCLGKFFPFLLSSMLVIFIKIIYQLKSFKRRASVLKKRIFFLCEMGCFLGMGFGLAATGLPKNP
jgi:hypothetical protein